MVLKEFSSILRKKRPIKSASQSALKKAAGKTPGGILLKNRWYQTLSKTEPRAPIQDFRFDTRTLPPQHWARGPLRPVLARWRQPSTLH